VSPERIEKEMRALDWTDVLADRTPYKDLVWRRKVDEGAYLLDVEIGLHGKRLRFPTGMRAGQKLGFEIQAYLLPVADVNDFDSCRSRSAPSPPTSRRAAASCSTTAICRKRSSRA
jgi:hypothetical protein